MGLALALVAAYLVGAVPVSFLVCKIALGVDLRQVGSGNVGATNAYRAGGARAGVPALAGDALKGTLAVMLGRMLAPAPGPLSPLARDLSTGAAAVLGHSYTLFLGFRGGKGVATAAGVLLALAPASLALSLAVFVLVVAVTRLVSLASILASVTLPAWIALLRPHGWPALSAATALLALFIVARHRENIRRIAAGTEPRIAPGSPVNAPAGGAFAAAAAALAPGSAGANAQTYDASGRCTATTPAAPTALDAPDAPTALAAPAAPTTPVVPATPAAVPGGTDGEGCGGAGGAAPR